MCFGSWTEVYVPIPTGARVVLGSPYNTRTSQARVKQKGWRLIFTIKTVKSKKKNNISSSDDFFTINNI